MRLIDADKLEEKIDDISRGYTSVYGVEEDDIYNAETVEAIPVDWIESYLLNCEVGSIVYCVIKQMLYKWREEQQQHDSD